MIYVKILCKLQALLDYLSETSSLCWPHYKNGLQVLVVYTDVNNEVNVSRVFFSYTVHRRPALLFAPAVGTANQQSLSCFDSKQQSLMNKMQTSFHVLYKPLL